MKRRQFILYNTAAVVGLSILSISPPNEGAPIPDHSLIRDYMPDDLIHHIGQNYVKSNPEVIVFDEPTNGLDPEGIAEIRNLIKELSGEGRTIIMASHILDEVEKVCTHVSIIKNGNHLISGSVGSIISNDVQIEIAAPNLDGLKNMLSNDSRISKLEEKEGKLFLFVDNEFSTAEINQMAHNNGITLTHLVAKAKSLESEFLEITSKN